MKVITITVKIRSSRLLYKISLLFDDTLAGAYDFVSIFSIAVLLFIGVTAIYSSHSYSHGTQWLMQMLWIACGTLVYFSAAKIDYSFWQKQAYLMYVASIVLLLLLWTPLGERRFGAVRWIKMFGLVVQPSELAKVGFIVMLSMLMAHMEISTFLNSIKNLAKCFFVCCMPTALVFLQPDLGSALTFPIVFFAMLYVSNLSKKIFAYLFAMALLVLSVVVVDIYGYRNFLDRQHMQDNMVTEKYENLSIVPLKDYQRDRIISFIFPDAVDPHGIGISWNLRQSLIAVGSGGLLGKGFNRGTQAKLGYLPRSVASNDFVFSVIAEERGLVGSLVVILSYFLIINSGLRAASRSRDKFGTYLCVGASMLFLLHVFTNVGMTIGLMPITGIPLPFLSYGGSFLLICCFLQGVIQSVNRYHRTFT